MNHNGQRTTMKYENGNERQRGAEMGGEAPNCSEPTMNYDVGRQAWRSERHPLSLAHSGCSVCHQVSLGCCRDIQSIGTGIGRSCSVCYPPIQKPLHAARRAMSAASRCPEATAAFQNNHILSQIKMMDPSRAPQPPAPYGRQTKERGK